MLLLNNTLRLTLHSLSDRPSRRRFFPMHKRVNAQCRSPTHVCETQYRRAITIHVRSVTINIIFFCKAKACICCRRLLITPSPAVHPLPKDGQKYQMQLLSQLISHSGHSHSVTADCSTKTNEYVQQLTSM